MNQKYIITGAPGTGKTSLINELLKRGISCSKEISREIILEQLANKGDILPWKNLKQFSERVASDRKEQYNNAPNNKLHFFDRSVIDVIAYMKIANLDYSSISKDIDYNKMVFYTPVWKEIYIQDNERKETFEQAIEIENSLLNTYKELGYSLIKIPKLTIKERVSFILSKIEG